MSHNPALDAHEHRENAEHAANEGDPFISRVSITVAMSTVTIITKRWPLLLAALAFGGAGITLLAAGYSA